MDTTNPTSPVRRGITYLMGAIAVLTCPCHLPILMALLSGTAAGALLQENVGLAAGLLLPVFLLSAIATWRLLDRSPGGKSPQPLPRGPQRHHGTSGSRAGRS
jgi:mercuric ion transport protein